MTQQRTPEELYNALPENLKPLADYLAALNEDTAEAIVIVATAVGEVRDSTNRLHRKVDRQFHDRGREANEPEEPPPATTAERAKRAVRGQVANTRPTVAEMARITPPRGQRGRRGTIDATSEEE